MIDYLLIILQIVGIKQHDMLHFFRRFNLFGKTGVNVGKTGASISSRGKRGSIGTSGFSIKTPIKGLGFRFRWSSLLSLILGGRR